MNNRLQIYENSTQYENRGKYKYKIGMQTIENEKNLLDYCENTIARRF